jgi:mono/diheme cytochrome c family protein
LRVIIFVDRISEARSPERRGVPRRIVVRALTATLVVFGAIAVRGQERPEPGRRAFLDAGCASCHGPSGQGGTAPALAGTARSYSDFLRIVREGSDEMPARAVSELSDEQVALIHAWLTQMPGRSR